MKQIIILALAALMAGCTEAPPLEAADEDNTSMPGPGFAPQTGHQEDAQGDLSLVGDLRVTNCDEAFCIHAQASNEGSSPTYVSNICVSPWSESMQSSGKDVQKSEPMAFCQAWGVREFTPGETMQANFTWDGQLWNDDAGESQPAAEGSYTWSIHFFAYSEENGGNRIELRLDFPVIIGET